MAEKKSDFVVQDRRRFTDEGELNQDAAKPEEPATTPTQSSAAEPESTPNSPQDTREMPAPPTAAEQHEQHGHYQSASKTIDEILANEVASFRRRSGAVVTVSAPSFQPDSASQAIAIKAVLRESLSNIAKHANATTVKIVVDRAPNGILVEIEDDGVGFDVADVRKDAIGLLSMEQRVALLGGDFTILSRPGGPTVVSACFERWFDGAAAA